MSYQLREGRTDKNWRNKVTRSLRRRKNKGKITSTPIEKERRRGAARGGAKSLGGKERPGERRNTFIRREGRKFVSRAWGLLQ